MARTNHGDRKPDDFLEAAAVCSLVLILIIGLFWLLKGEVWVRSWTAGLFWIARSWLWVPQPEWQGFARPLVEHLHVQALGFLAEPKKVGFFDWMTYIQWCLLPLSFSVGLALCGLTIRVLLIKPKPIFEVLKPTQLMRLLSHRFTGIAPVIHLRRALVKNTDPLWRRQTFPHEVLLKERVNGKPLVVDGQIDPQAVRDWFMGIETERGPQGIRPVTHGDRLVSRQLGHQVVNLVSDAGKDHICYADRMSPAGKVVYALLTARAFGGAEGKVDYETARDQLNNSARGERSGRPNFKVAQWLYDKYRMHPTARRVCAVHHWEHTVLWALLVYAKRQGKCGHWEWLWLKPTARFMFYALNTVGRLTPHTESAAAFSQYIYERRVAKRRRLPLMRKPDGGYVHVIFVEKAVKGLALEWDRWCEGDDKEGDEFWMSDEGWKQLRALSLPPSAPPAALSEDTPFDTLMRQQAADSTSTSAKKAGNSASASGSNDLSELAALF